MIEPPQPGFTGVVWEAREPDRLTRELSTGPGAIPMAEAGITWAKLAAGFGTAVLEYDQIINSLHGAWESTTSQAVLDRIAVLRDWLTNAASSAGENATRAEKQAAAHQLARMTMPNAGDIAALQQAQRALEAVSGSLGAPIKAVAAQTDAEADLAKAAASRVMRSYEAATEPLAMPWHQEQPPSIANSTALEAEQAKATKLTPTSTMPTGMPVMPFIPGQFAVPRTLTGYRAPVLQQSATTTAITPQPIPATSPTASSAMVPPGAMAPAAAAAAAQEEEYQPRAGATMAADEIGADLGIVSAPAVLGAPEPATSTGQAQVSAGGGS